MDEDKKAPAQSDSIAEEDPANQSSDFAAIDFPSTESHAGKKAPTKKAPPPDCVIGHLTDT